MNHALPLTQRTATGYQIGQLHAALKQGLSPRETQLLLYRATGLTEPEIAQQMDCSVSNVKNISSNTLYKLKAKRITAAVAEAFRKGIIHYLVIAVFIFGNGIANTAIRVRTQRPTTCRIQQRRTNHE